MKYTIYCVFNNKVVGEATGATETDALREWLRSERMAGRYSICTIASFRAEPKKACPFCRGGYVYDNTCNSYEPCPMRCEKWQIADAIEREEDANLSSLEDAYMPISTTWYFHEEIWSADHECEIKER